MADSASKRLQVNETNGHCAGHFPGHPIVPAAAQAMWILNLAKEQLPNATSWDIKQFKLLRELRPGREVEISLTLGKFGWLGKVADHDGPYAQLTLIAHE